MIRKFFDTATAEPATQVVDKPSIAALMAKQGVVNNSENPVATPVPIPERTEEPKSDNEPAPAAIANTVSPEPAKPETPLPEKVEQSTPEPQKEVAEVNQRSWQEVLKSQQPDTVLKELGYDEKVLSLTKKLADNPKMVAFFNHWETEGNVKDYLRELSTDYKQMPAEEVMRHQLRKEYPNASAAALDVLYKKEVIKAYGLDSDDETELEEGKLLLEAKAERYRSEMINNQEKYLLSAPTKPTVEPDNTDQLIQQEIDSQISQVTSSDFFRNIVANKGFVFGEGAEKFFYPIENPKEIVDTIYDSTKWLQSIFDKKSQNGKDVYVPKSEHQLLVGLTAKYGKAFLDAYAKHFKSLGGNEAIAPIENASEVNTAGTAASVKTAPMTAAEAMARQGVLNSGGYNR